MRTQLMPRRQWLRPKAVAVLKAAADVAAAELAQVLSLSDLVQAANGQPQIRQAPRTCGPHGRTHYVVHDDKHPTGGWKIPCCGKRRWRYSCIADSVGIATYSRGGGTLPACKPQQARSRCVRAVLEESGSRALHTYSETAAGAASPLIHPSSHQPPDPPLSHSRSAKCMPRRQKFCTAATSPRPADQLSVGLLGAPSTSALLVKP
jgi:hypothetical protein